MVVNNATAIKLKSDNTGWVQKRWGDSRLNKMSTSLDGYNMCLDEILESSGRANRTGTECDIGQRTQLKTIFFVTGKQLPLLYSVGAFCSRI